MNESSPAMKMINRRRFLKTSALAAGSLSLLPPFTATRAAAQSNVHTRVRGANEDIRMAVVGFNSRGRDHIKELGGLQGMRVVALCDVDSKVLAREVKNFKDKNQDVAGYSDIRKLLENPDIDAISIATPNHWHSLAALWAVQAGKDVYVEKPISHNVWEGGQVVKAARNCGRIVQAGTQSRSSTGLREAMAWLHDDNLGKIIRARALCYKRRPSIGKSNGPQPVPDSVDYDLWLGPAPKEPPHRLKFHYDWHWFWATGNGDIGNQGIHEMDVARWALGETALSPAVFSFGGRFGYEDDGQTPNTLIVYHDYKAAPLIFEVRGLPDAADSKNMDRYRGVEIGVVIDCEHGSMVIPSYNEARVFDTDGKQTKDFKGGGSHFANFLGAVRSRKVEDLNADILDGHISAALVHTGNISYRLGKQASPEKIREQIKGSPDAIECLGRMHEHLNANQVDLAKTEATLGIFLKIDPPAERFVGNRQANRLLTREYRHPFVVPEKV
jgi:predicted dehydrogenase